MQQNIFTPAQFLFTSQSWMAGNNPAIPKVWHLESGFILYMLSLQKLTGDRSHQYIFTGRTSINQRITFFLQNDLLSFSFWKSRVFVGSCYVRFFNDVTSSKLPSVFYCFTAGCGELQRVYFIARYIKQMLHDVSAHTYQQDLHLNFRVTDENLC